MTYEEIKVYREKCGNIMWKGTVSAYFRANHSKLCRNCAFPQNFHTRKLDEIAVFYEVIKVELSPFVRNF